jgi:hypothetical protein
MRGKRKADEVAADSGQVMLLILGFAVILGLLVTVVVDASHLFLERRALEAATDASALAAAQAIDEAAVYAGGTTGTVPLDRDAVGTRLDDYLAAADLTDRFRSLHVERIDTDGRAVTVELSAVVRLPFLNIVTGDVRGLRIDAIASAQTAVA